MSNIEFHTLNQINSYLIERNIMLTMNNYFNEILGIHKNPIDTKILCIYMNCIQTPYFINLDVEFLFKYSIIKKWNNPEKFMKKAGLVEARDYYSIGIVGEKKNEIKLSLYGFKLCLMRSKSKYAHQYAMLEEIHKYYIEYLHMMDIVDINQVFDL